MGIQENIEINGEILKEPKYEIPAAVQKEIVLTEYIKNSLDIVAKNEGFHHYEFIVDHGSSIGDGFVGIMIKVIIQELDKSKLLQVLAKIPPFSMEVRTMMKSMQLFEREVFMYNILLPEFVNFQKERRIGPSQGFFNFPKIFYADYDANQNESIIIMEDLRNSGHRMWDKTKPVNYEHAKLIMTALGRFHALSLAMKAKKPEQFEKCKELNDYFKESFTDEKFKNILNQSLDRAKGTLEANDVKAQEKFQKLIDNAANILNNCSDPSYIEPQGIVSHGDCWVNNFLFHYKKGDVPTEIVLIDFQTSRYSSPVVDLTYFLFACTDHELRKNHFDELLNIYHHSLKELLDHLGGDTATQFPMTALLRHMKKFAKFGIVMATFIIPMLQTKKEDIPDMDFIAKNIDNEDPELVKAFMEKMGKQEDTVSKRMRDVIHDAIKYGLL